MFRRVVNLFRFSLGFLTISVLISFPFGYWGILEAHFANQISLLNKKGKAYLIIGSQIRILLGRSSLGSSDMYIYFSLYVYIPPSRGAYSNATKEQEIRSNSHVQLRRLHLPARPRTTISIPQNVYIYINIAVCAVYVPN